MLLDPQFLAEQILAELDRLEIKTFDNFDVSAITEIERSLPSLQERSPFSELSELDLT